MSVKVGENREDRDFGRRGEWTDLPSHFSDFKSKRLAFSPLSLSLCFLFSLNSLLQTVSEKEDSCLTKFLIYEKVQVD